MIRRIVRLATQKVFADAEIGAAVITLVGSSVKRESPVARILDRVTNDLADDAARRLKEIPTSFDLSNGTRRK